VPTIAQMPSSIQDGRGTSAETAIALLSDDDDDEESEAEEMYGIRTGDDSDDSDYVTEDAVDESFDESDAQTEDEDLGLEWSIMAA